MSVFPFLKAPGIPWNLDVSLIALVFIAVGYYKKEQIHKLLHCNGVKCDLTALLATVILIVFCIFNYSGGAAWHYLDMKYAYYNELLSTVVIPSLFCVVLCRISHWVERMRILSDIFALLGRMTIPIMFLHMPLNQWQKTLGYGRSVYVLISIGIPLIFTIVFCRFKVMRTMFGLPDLVTEISVLRCHR